MFHLFFRGVRAGEKATWTSRVYSCDLYLLLVGEGRGASGATKDKSDGRGPSLAKKAQDYSSPRARSHSNTGHGKRMMKVDGSGRLFFVAVL